MQRALYAPHAGYFAKQDAVSTAPPMNFSSMLGSLEFRQRVQEAYEGSAQEWLTPSELFAPHWSHALAEYVVQSYQQLTAPGLASAAVDSIDLDGVPDADAEKLPPLHVYEIGAGTGTNALHFCTYLQQYYPHLYSCLRFTIIEISEPLAAKQLALLRSAGHGPVVRSVVADASQIAADERIANPDPCFVLMQEVLDNLPHDKVVRASQASRRQLSQAPVRTADGAVPQQLKLLQVAASMAAATAEVTAPPEARWHHVTVSPGGSTPPDTLSWGEAMGLGADSSQASTGQLQLAPLCEGVAELQDPWTRCAASLCIDTRPDIAARGSLAHIGALYGQPDPSPPVRTDEGLQGTLQRAADWLYPESHPAAVDAAMQADLQTASAAYVPTTALQLLSGLSLALPRHHLIAADFAVLPASRSAAAVPASSAAEACAVGAPSAFDQPVQAFIPAVGEPLTASKPFKGGSAAPKQGGARTPLSATAPGGAAGGLQGGGLHDHPTYLSPRIWGSADIYFSSDFCALQHAARYLRLAQESALVEGGWSTLPAAQLPVSEAWQRSLQELQLITAKAGNAARSTAQRSTVHTTAEFVGRYARGIAAKTRTLTGYNPLLHGYSNTQFLLVDNSLLGVGTVADE